MKGGRLKIVNETGYDTGEVEALVRFGLSEIDLTGDRLVVVVRYTRRGYGHSGTYWSLREGIPSKLYDRYCGRSYTRHFAVLRVGDASAFPIRAGKDHPEIATWQEALVMIAAHEGKHAEHEHDGAYRQQSGRRTTTVRYRLPGGETVERKRIIQARVGTERVEPKCVAFENYMLRRFRAWREQAEFASLCG